MARPYSAGDLSRAQRARHAVGPLLLVPARRGLSKTAGLPSPRVPGAILIVSDSTLNGFGAR
jgi:hypothetical protein